MERCPYCSIAAARVTLDTEHALAFGDGYHVAEGHTLVVPRLRVPSIFDLAPEVQAAVWSFVDICRYTLENIMYLITVGTRDTHARKEILVILGA
ncbi:MAG: HIT domain-containing protein [Candidatus Solibacter sp.]|nr:HIT domain-containing protein [Candidatus Solibacter sp.]